MIFNLCLQLDKSLEEIGASRVEKLRLGADQYLNSLKKITIEHIKMRRKKLNQSNCNKDELQRYIITNIEFGFEIIFKNFLRQAKEIENESTEFIAFENMKV